MLDHHGTGVARIVVRSEEDEQSVVAVFPRAGLAAAETLSETTCAVPVLPAISMSGIGRRARPAVPGPLTTSFIAWRMISLWLPWKFIEFELRRLPVENQPRHDLAARGKARGHHRQLQRIGQHVALADRGVDRVVRLPFAPVSPHQPCRIGHGAEELAGDRQGKFLLHAAGAAPSAQSRPCRASGRNDRNRRRSFGRCPWPCRPTP